MADKILHEGRFTRTVSRDGWEFIERKNCSGVVGIIAVTSDQCLLLVEQFRPPLNANVIEIPAGLVGDGEAGDTPSAAAERELFEETGYKPQWIRHLVTGPTTTGLSSETISIFVATDCTKQGAGGGVEGESIVVHSVPIASVAPFLLEQMSRGKVVDLKVWLAVGNLSMPVT